MNEPSEIYANDLAVVALGGNLPGEPGSVQATLEAALVALAEAGLTPLARSRWWGSAAWPDASDPPFLNGVALVQTALDPMEMLDRLESVQAQFGPRDGPRNAPRVLDLDLIALGRQTLDTPRLTLPHPRAAERLFVMGPLADVAPGWVHPVLGEAAEALAAKATVGGDAQPIGE